VNEYRLIMKNYFMILNEDSESEIYLSVDKLWVKDDRLYIRVVNKEKPSEELNFKKEKGEGVYSKSIRELHDFHVYLWDHSRNEPYRIMDEYEKLFVDDYCEVDLMIDHSLDKLKSIFRNDTEILEVIKRLKDPVGFIFARNYLNKNYLKKKILNLKKCLGTSHFIVLGPILNRDFKKFLEENEINVIDNFYKFLSELRKSIL